MPRLTRSSIRKEFTTGGGFVQVWGDKDVIKNLRKYNYATHYNLRRVWREVGVMVAKEAQKLIRPRGAMTAFVTGHLHDNISGGAVRTKMPDGYEVKVTSAAVYSLLVHEGLGSNTRKGPRPFLIVAMKNKQGAIQRKIVIEQNKLERRISMGAGSWGMSTRRLSVSAPGIRSFK